MVLLCKLLIWICLYGLFSVPGLAQEVGHDQSALRHHPAQDQQLHGDFYSKWHMPDNPAVSCCNEADCYPTEIKYIHGEIYAKRRRRESTFPFRRKGGA